MSSCALCAFFIIWLLAFLWLLHCKAFASNDASTKGKGEEKVVWGVLRGCCPTGGCADPGSTLKHQNKHFVPLKAQLMVEIPAASFSFIVKLGGKVCEGALPTLLCSVAFYYTSRVRFRVFLCQVGSGARQACLQQGTCHQNASRLARTCVYCLLHSAALGFALPCSSVVDVCPSKLNPEACAEP